MSGDREALLAALHDAIGTTDESQGLEHWHHASGGRSDNGERNGVFVDRQQVLDTIDAAFDTTEAAHGHDPATCKGCASLVVLAHESATEATLAASERIADDNGDELEHGKPDFPGQFPATPEEGLPTAEELAQAITECAPRCPGIHAEAEAILVELRRNRQSKS